MKRGKEITLDINSNYKIKIGTVDNKNTKSIYINLSAWGKLNNEDDRMEALAALQCVDYVVIFDQEDPKKILEEIRPDIHVKGGDYNIDQIIEKESVEKNSGKVVLIPEVKGHSTTDLIKKIVGLHKED